MTRDPPTTAAERAPLLAERRALKMARSAHAFVRGSTEHFYAWLAAHGARLPAGPPIWICGDCHVGNLGPVGACAGAAVVELRDLDQSVIANPAFDIVRLALSLAMAARSSDLPGVTTAQMTEDLIVGYEQAFDGERPTVEADRLPEPLRFVMKRAIERTCRHLFEERLGGMRRSVPLGKRFWPLTAEEHAEVARLVESETIRDLVTALEWRDDDHAVTFEDAAYWVKGCSSLGLWRAAVLVRVGDARQKRKTKKKSTLSLLDIKEAAPPVCPHDAGAVPRHHGRRVVSAATHLAPALGQRMAHATIAGRDVFVRELLPQDLKVELDQISVEDSRAVAHYLGMVVGRAHSRQLDGDGRRAWTREIAARRTKNIDAPSWLWENVVDLVADHERAYLEHCRRYALSRAHADDRDDPKTS